MIRFSDAYTETETMAKKRANDCPLYQHGNGQWCKRIKGKLHYFGTDKDKALEKWADERDYLLAGRVPPKKDASPALSELGNLFVARCRERVSAGEMEARTAKDYESCVGRLIQILGRDCRPEHLRPIDYGKVRAELAEPVERKRNGGRTVERRSPGSVGGDIRRLRVFLNWATKAELIPPPKFGDEFSPPSRKLQRRKRATDGRRDFSSEELRAILANCRPSLRAMVLIAANGGVGNLDLGNLRFDHIKGLETADPWIDYPRGKTGAPRRFPLWEETAQAIRDYLEERPHPRSSRFESVVFLTRGAHPWVRFNGKTTTDSIGFEFTKARRAAGLTKGSFYDLRRTFRTVAAGSRDREAVDLIMGHADSADDMGAVYTQHIDDERLGAVCEHVRGWLFSEERV